MWWLANQISWFGENRAVNLWPLNCQCEQWTKVLDDVLLASHFWCDFAFWSWNEGRAIEMHLVSFFLSVCNFFFWSLLLARFGFMKKFYFFRFAKEISWGWKTTPNKCMIRSTPLWQRFRALSVEMKEKSLTLVKNYLVFMVTVHLCCHDNWPLTFQFWSLTSTLVTSSILSFAILYSTPRNSSGNPSWDFIGAKILTSWSFNSAQDHSVTG